MKKHQIQPRQENVLAKNNLVPDDVYYEFLDTFRNLNKASQIINASLISNSCLVQKRKKKNPQLPEREVIKTVFTDILNSMKTNNLSYYEVLHGRFWLGKSIQEMRTSYENLSISERTFKQMQRDAVFEFASRFLEQEETCKRTESFWQQVRFQVANNPLLAVGMVLSFLVLVISIYTIFSSDSGANKIEAQDSSSISTSLTETNVATDIPKQINTLCGESEAIQFPPTEESLIRHEGVSSFSPENTPNGILNNFIRSLAIGSKGILIGYHKAGSTGNGGLTYLEFDEHKWFWANCNEAVELEDTIVNSIVVDHNEFIWVATDGKGVLAYDGQEWKSYTTANSDLPSDVIYDLMIDDENRVWAATYKGIAQFNGQEWAIIYSSDNELPDNLTYAIAFDSSNNIWIGHVSEGISQFSGSKGEWISHKQEDGNIGGNNIRGIVVREATDTQSESVWFAIDGGGVAKYEAGVWTNFGLADGLPSEEVRTVAIDFHGRIWAGTVDGAAYFDGQVWHKYHSFSTLSIAFGPGCENSAHCENDQVWTGTEDNGLTHSRLPYAENTLDINQICFFKDSEPPLCSNLVEIPHPHIITATYPIPLSPGEDFYFDVQVAPLGGFELNASRDFLLHIGEDDTSLFGSYFNVPLSEDANSGQSVEFSLNDRRMIAPQLPDGVNKYSYISPWQVWMFTRLAGPQIHIVFTVEKPQQ